MMRKFPTALIGLCLMLAQPVLAAGVRDFTRSMQPGTVVNEAQASELTLTLTEAAARPIQHWVRTAGTFDSTGKVITAFVRSPDADLVRVGQRLRSFSMKSRTRMHLGKITRVATKPGGAAVEATLPAQAANDGSRYLVEIVVERGPFLSIPNVSIIEDGEEHIVYVQKEPGRYAPQAIEIGLQGELYTQVLKGLEEGDQVVSVGSFFVDAENKLKPAGMDHGSMPGMDHSQMPGTTQATTGSSGTPAGSSATPAAVQ